MEQATVSPNKQPTNENSTKPTYESNPFVTALTSFRVLLQINNASFIATVLLNIAAGIVLVLAVGWISIVTVAVIAKLNNLGLPNFLAQDAFSSPPTLIGAGLLAIICLLFTVYIQTVAFALTARSAAREAIGFGSLLSKSMQRFLPMLGLFGVVLAVVIALAIIAFLLAQVSQPVAIIFIVLASLGCLYAGLRTSFAGYSLVQENLGPWKSLVRSWRLTRRHIFETLGIIFATCIMLALPLGFIDLLASYATGTFIGILLQLMSGLAGLVLGIFMNMALAERYQQLYSVASGTHNSPKTHHTNYWVLPVFVVGMFAIGLLAPPTQQQQPGWGQPFMQQETPLPQNNEELPEEYKENNMPDEEYETEPAPEDSSYRVN